MKSAYTSFDNLEHILSALTWENALCMRVCIRYGLRLGDVLTLTPDQLKRGRFILTEHKTGKKRRIQITGKLRDDLLSISNPFWVFPGRNDPKKHRTRQAVWADVKRASKAFRLNHISPHSARKVFAVGLRERGYTPDEIRRILNHSDLATTYIYCYSDLITTPTK